MLATCNAATEAAARASVWLQTCPEALRQALIGSGCVLELSRDDVLFNQGDPSDPGIWLVLAGALRSTHATGRGQSYLATLLGPDCWSGLSALTGDRYLVTVVASESCRLLNVPAPALQRILREVPEAWPSFAAMLMAQRAALLDWLTEVVLLSPRPRLARRLSNLWGSGYGVQPPLARKLRLTQAELASALGVSRKTVNELLVEFATAGLIETGNRWVRVLDPQRLQALADELDPPPRHDEQRRRELEPASRPAAILELGVA